MLLLAFTFFGAEGTLSLTVTRGLGAALTQAGVALTAGTVCWAIGSLVQPGLCERLRISAATLSVAGAVVLLLASASVVTILVARPAPTVAALFTDATWAVAGLGTGTAYPTLMTTATAKADGSHAERLSAGIVLAEATGGSLGPDVIGGLYSLGLRWSLPPHSALLLSFGATTIGGLLLLVTTARALRVRS
ncbi:hypothetical protein [Streptomyces sp. TS71-3]|uniref:hypothetical protein n=1 Tax=Streptomyces sp. TS71-3 TaxID=2733862 RepID=UPI002016DDB6|nr:hypothetical protein [Streptomyces sp. TS71-3]